MLKRWHFIASRQVNYRYTEVIDLVALAPRDGKWKSLVDRTASLDTKMYNSTCQCVLHAISAHKCVSLSTTTLHSSAYHTSVPAVSMLPVSMPFTTPKLRSHFAIIYETNPSLYTKKCRNRNETTDRPTTADCNQRCPQTNQIRPRITTLRRP